MEEQKKIVGSAHMEDGSSRPIYEDEGRSIIAAIKASDARRKAAMPSEQSAILALQDAWTRLQDFGWTRPEYAPKDGSPLDIIELGSTGIHSGRYEGEWPKGSWWLFGYGDVWPTRPAMCRAATPADRGDAKP
jgi:hypothetical protein